MWVDYEKGISHLKVIFIVIICLLWFFLLQFTQTWLLHIALVTYMNCHYKCTHSNTINALILTGPGTFLVKVSVLVLLSFMDYMMLFHFTDKIGKVNGFYLTPSWLSTRNSSFTSMKFFIRLVSIPDKTLFKYLQWSRIGD